MKADIHVLVVDKNQPVRDFVVETLASRERFAASGASDGTRALEIAAADPPNLVLLDVETLQGDGLQLLDALHREQTTPPVILMTSCGPEGIAVEFLRKGVRDYLIKPFTAEDVHAAIERALTEVHLRREKETLTQRLAAANQQLRCRVQELDTLYQVGKSVTSLLASERVLEQVVDAVFHVLGAEEAALMLMDKDGDGLRTELHRQRVPGEIRQLARRSAEELATDAARKGTATASGAMLSAPLKVGDRVIGALSVGNRVSGQPFSRHDRRLLLALADYAAIAIENAHLYEEVKRADQEKSEFVSFVAHELRTPMTFIRGCADMLAQGMAGPLAPEQKQLVETVCVNARRMQVLVSDLQDVSQTKIGQLWIEMEPTDLASAVREAVQATQSHIEAQAQHLSVDIPDDLPPVRAAPARLTRILINLLSNAHKYTPNGGYIGVRAWLQRGYVHCAVSDSGIGITQADQARLFIRFFRSENPAVRQMPGTGLGLCIVKSLVELQGGEIQVDSQSGKGTTFTFTVPVAT
jgi:signal transduction histidine kinase